MLSQTQVCTSKCVTVKDNSMLIFIIITLFLALCSSLAVSVNLLADGRLLIQFGYQTKHWFWVPVNPRKPTCPFCHQLFQYEEMYSSALDGYSRAAALDPGWEDAQEREKQLLKYLDQITMLLETKVREIHWHRVGVFNSFLWELSYCGIDNRSEDFLRASKNFWKVQKGSTLCKCQVKKWQVTANRYQVQVCHECFKIWELYWSFCWI